MNSRFSLSGSRTGNHSSLRRALAPLSLAAVLAVAASSQAHAQIFVSGDDTDVIGEYGADGSSINANFITNSTPGASLQNPQDMIVANGNLYVANEGGSTIGEYSASTGATVDASFISGLSVPNPLLLAASGTSLYVGSETGGITEYSLSNGAKNTSFSATNTGSVQGLAVLGTTLLELDANTGKVNEFNASTGASLSSTPLFTVPGGQGAATGMTLVGNDLFVVSSGKVFEYDATNGTQVSSNLISGLGTAFAITSFGNELYVTSSGTGTSAPFGTGFVGEYNLDGSAVNSDLISGLTAPFGVAVEAVPEPSSWALGLVAFGSVVVLLRRRRATLAVL